MIYNARMNETYTPGYCASAVTFMSGRSAKRQAHFILPRLKPGMRLLDIGCGPGTITVGLAAAVAPGPVIGIDMAESQLELARKNAAKNQIGNIRFQPASIYELPFGDGEFDVVFSHAVFEHLKEPVAALREIHRVLAADGLVALRTPDWGGFLVHPLSPDIEAAMEHFQAIQMANGGNVLAGRRLKDWVLAAGFRAAQWSGSIDEDAYGVSEFLAGQLETHAAAGTFALDAETLTCFTTALRQLANQPGAIFATSWGEIIATK